MFGEKEFYEIEDSAKPDDKLETKEKSSAGHKMGADDVEPVLLWTRCDD